MKEQTKQKSGSAYKALMMLFASFAPLGLPKIIAFQMSRTNLKSVREKNSKSLQVCAKRTIKKKKGSKWHDNSPGKKSSSTTKTVLKSGNRRNNNRERPSRCKKTIFMFFGNGEFVVVVFFCFRVETFSILRKRDLKLPKKYFGISFSAIAAAAAAVHMEFCVLLQTYCSHCTRFAHILFCHLFRCVVALVFLSLSSTPQRDTNWNYYGRYYGSVFVI